MDAFDEALFSLALRDAFEQVTMIQNYNYFHPPKEIRILEIIPDCEDYWGAILHIPIFRKPPENADDGWPNSQHFHFNRSHWIYTGPGASRWAFKPPTLMQGSVGTSWHYGDNAAQAIVGKVWRILAKVTTNRVKVEFPRKGIVLSDGSKGGWTWFGHHALKWCRSDPEYMLNAQRRPADDWEVPNSEWYQDLRRRVTERYGADFGKPEPPEDPGVLPA